MYAVSPIAYPISLILDKLLGEHHKTRFNNTDLKALIEFHTYNALSELKLLDDEHQNDDPDNLNQQNSNNMGIDFEQADLIKSVLEINALQAASIMILTKNIFMLSQDEVIDKYKLQLILEKGYSRIPVYVNKDKNDIIGIYLF